MSKYKFSQNNPDIDVMKEQGWAFVQVSKHTSKHGEPYVSHEYAEKTEKSDRFQHERQEVRIVTW